jgi:hypothetical protein
MKTKGIPLWEQHIQHIVLGVAVLAGIAFTVMQFIGNPNAVEIGKGAGKRTVGPGEIDEILVAQANELLVGLAPDAPPPVEIPDSDPMLAGFSTDLTDSISAESSIFWPEHPWDPPVAEIAPSDFMYAIPQVPAPYATMCVQEHASIPQDLIDTHEQLQALLPTQPYDLTWTTPAAVFSLRDTLAEFRARGDGEDTLAIPASWYPAPVAIIDVVVEREELVDDQWTNRIVLDPISGQRHFRKELALDDLNAGDRDYILDQLQDSSIQKQVVQPPFFEVVNNNWAPPDPFEPDEEDFEADPNAAKIAAAKRRHTRLVTDRAELQEKVDNECRGVGEGDDRDRGGNDDDDKGGGGRGAPGGSGMGSGGTKSGRGNREDKEEKIRLCAAWRRQLQTLDRQIRRSERKLEELGANAEEMVVDDIVTDPMQEDELVIWAHDLNIEIGATYRYRFTVEVYNPFFARKLNLKDEQQELAEAMTRSSKVGEWSRGIDVEPPLEFWITKASAPTEGRGRNKAAGSAQAEVFRFYDGRWWSDKFNVAPGERIGKVANQAGRDEPPVDIDFGTDWFPVDIVYAPTERDDDAAEVLLQNLRTGQLEGYLDPASAEIDPRLQKLRELVDAADADRIALAGGG